MYDVSDSAGGIGFVLQSYPDIIMTLLMMVWLDSIIVVGGDAHLAFQYHNGLVLGGVVMHRYLRAWFQHVEKTVALVGKVLVKMVVHSQPWRLPCLLGNVLNELVVNDSHFVYLIGLVLPFFFPMVILETVSSQSIHQGPTWHLKLQLLSFIYNNGVI